MESFTKNARRSAKIGINPSRTTALAKRLRNSLPSNVSGSMGKVNIGRASTRFSELSFGSTTLRRVVPDFRRGELNSALKKSGNRASVSGLVEVNTKKLFSRQFPDVELIALQKRRDRLALLNTDLTRALRTQADFDSLTPAARSKVQRTFDKLKSKGTLKLVGGFTVLALAGGGAATLLTQAAARRNGCWAIVNNNGKNIYCKLVRRSCGAQEGGTPCAGTEIDSHSAGNLYYMVLLAKNKADIRANIEAATKEPIPYNGDFDAYMNRHAEALAEFYGNLDPSQIDIRGELCVDATGAAISDGCVMCDPSADPASRNYVDASELPDNVTYQCVQNSSVIDVINDIGGDIVSIGNGVFGGIQTLFKYGLWALVAVVVLFASVFLFRLLPVRPPAATVATVPPRIAVV